MLRRAEQLKVLLCHSRAHHLSLLAALLQLLHRQEVEQYDEHPAGQQQEHEEEVHSAQRAAQASAAAPAGTACL